MGTLCRSEEYYAALQIYRSDIIIPFGLFSMLIQAVTFAWIYDKALAPLSGKWLTCSIRYAAVGGILSWSFTTIAVAAKNVMASVPDYLLDPNGIHRRPMDHRSAVVWRSLLPVEGLHRPRQRLLRRKLNVDRQSAGWSAATN